MVDALVDLLIDLLWAWAIVSAAFTVWLVACAWEEFWSHRPPRRKSHQ